MVVSLPPPRALVILAEGAEETEVVVTVDVLRRGGVEVVVAGLGGDRPVSCSRGITLVPDLALAEADGSFDALILPGGAGGAERLATHPEVGRRLRQQITEMGLVAAICAAPTALLRHQVFLGRPMTCHPSVKDVVAASAQYRAEPVVEDAGLITAQGAGCSFVFALTVLRRLQGEAAMQHVIGPLAFDRAPAVPKDKVKGAM